MVVTLGLEHNHNQHRSWGCTLFTQIALCMALYMAFYIGNPSPLISKKRIENSGRDRDLYFLSVCGGHRPFKQQTHLLKMMEKVAKIYKVKFVVNISEGGEDDPLQNDTSNFPSLKIPWYTTRTSQGQGLGYFLKQIMLPHEQILDIIGLDTNSLHDFLHREQLSAAENSRLLWLMRTLALSNSKWRLVVGYHPLIVCKEQQHAVSTTKVSESLHRIFLQYRVNAYLSKQGCSGYYTRNEGIAYIGNPDHIDKNHQDTLIDGTFSFVKNMHDDGFLMHRVSPLEIVSYFIDSSSKVIFKSTLHQWGKEVM